MSEVPEMFPLILVNSSMNIPETGMMFKDSVTFDAWLESAENDMMVVTLYVHDSQSGHKWQHTFEKKMKMRSLEHFSRNMLQIAAQKPLSEQSLQSIREELASVEGCGVVFVGVYGYGKLYLEVVICTPSEFCERSIVDVKEFDPFRKN